MWPSCKVRRSAKFVGLGLEHLVLGPVDSYGLRDPLGGRVGSGRLGCVIIRSSRLISVRGWFVELGA